MKKLLSSLAALLAVLPASLGTAAVAQTVDVTYTYKMDETVLGTKTVTETVGETPSEQANIPYYVTATGFPETIDESTTNVTVTTSYKNIMPFKVSDEEKTYYILSFHVNNKKYQWSAENGSTGKEVRVNSPSKKYDELFNYTTENQKLYKWEVGGDWFNGFTFKSESGKYVTAPGETFNNGAQVNLTDNADTDFSRYMMEPYSNTNTGLWLFRLKGKSHCLAHTSDATLQLSLWEAASDYAGWPVYFEEVGDLAADVENTTKEAEYLLAQSVGYPIDSAPVRTALQEGLDKLKTMNPADRENCLNVQALIANYGTCTDVVMPEDGKAYYLHNVQQTGDGYMLAADNSNLVVVDYDDENKGKLNTIFVCHKVGDKYLFTNGEEGNFLVWKGTNSGYNNNTGFAADYTEPFCNFTLTSRASTKVGTFTLLSKRNDNSDGTIIVMPSKATKFDSYSNAVGWSATFSNLFILEPVEYDYNNVTLQKPVKQVDGEAYNYGSVYLPFAVTIPEGVEACTVTRKDDKLDLHAVSGTLPAHTAAVLRSEVLTDVLLVPATEAAKFEGENELTGTMTVNEQTPGNVYVLNCQSDSGLGFYPYTSATLPVGQAYFVDENGAEKWLFSGQTTTGIDSATIDGDKADNAPWYDLVGRRVTAPTKGIYVRGGKKLLVK